MQVVGFYSVHWNLEDDTTYVQHRKTISGEDGWVPKAEVDQSNAYSDTTDCRPHE